MTKKIKLVILSMVICIASFAQKGYRNPAATYCETLGYKYSVQTDKQGNEVGMCTLPSGQTVNAWDFYKGKVAKEYSYAAKKGYNIETVTEKIDGYVTEYAVCTRDVKGLKERVTLNELMEKNGDKMELATRGPEKDIYEVAKYNPNFTASKANPASFDWRNYNGHSYIGPVRDQGSCGSCYSFGANACAEGTYNFATGKYDSNTADFSESYIIYCLSAMPAYKGHFGGTCAKGADYSYSELQALCDVGVVNESVFPYLDQDQTCPSAASTASKTKFSAWYRVPCSNIEAIKTAIMTYGVVDAAVDATATSWNNYSGGIYSDTKTACNGSPCENTTTDHAIALVGWGHDATAGDYWILRNSWGSSWGESGYMRVAVTSCRVACSVCYLVYTPSAPDTQAPTAPTNLASSNITSSGCSLSWTASTDNVAVTGYDVYKNGSFLANTTTTSYNVTGLTAATAYSFYVKAKDAAGNASAASNTVNVTTLNGGSGTTVTIGTGTSTQGYPINCYYGYERSASIYTAAEVGTTGSISIVEWYPTVATTYNVPVKIYIKQTTASTITATTWANSISGATLVYSGTMAGTTANTWKTFTLTTPFSFTGGTNNLMVLVETNYGGTGAGSSTGPAVRYTSATSKHMYIRADNSAPTGNGTVTSYRPNIRLTISGGVATPKASNDLDLNVDESISAYPNPTTGIITIKSEGSIRSIDVYSITGAKIYSKSNINDNASKEIDLSNSNSGVYIIIVNDGFKNHTLKVTKR
ncbi:MAG: DUF333 domain-containing protein [Bacteroidales bacterium]|nr:DUF333 domain-containing protein [Bacteroidales bacterium]